MIKCLTRRQSKQKEKLRRKFSRKWGWNRNQRRIWL